MNALWPILGAVLFIGCCAMCVAYFTEKWIQNNPACNRCGVRGKKNGVEIITLSGGQTSFCICEECRNSPTIESEEFEWFAVLFALEGVTKTTLPNFDVTSLSFWPKNGNMALTLDEISRKVLVVDT